MGFADCSSKTCVIILSIIQLLVAIAMMAAGIAVFVTFGNIQEFAQEIHTLVPASILIAAGVLLVILAFVGCCGALKENKCALAIFFVLSGAIFVIEMVGACMALVMKGDFEKVVNDGYNDFFHKYNSSSNVRDEVDWIQKTFQCCGSYNGTDFTTMGLDIPSSCCQFFNSTIVPPFCTEAVLEEYHVTGCLTKLHDLFFDNLDIIGGVGIAFAFVQIVALVGVLVLLCRRKEYTSMY